ncbi:MAG TPA: hypothetical protein VLJ15_04150 [Gammaproteobacteria bacterium]|nr:hypothetical protein [Gammaproteobacteria bacterium]
MGFDRLNDVLSSLSPKESDENYISMESVPKNEEENTIDFWSAIGGIGELLSKAISNVYWGVDLAHLIYKPTDDDDPAHYAIYAVGAAFALMAVGAAYLHTILNMHHHDDNTSSVTTEPRQEKPTKMEWLALATDYGTHIGETSGPLSFGFDVLTTHLVDTTLPAWVNPVSKITLTLFSAVTAVADVRTCFDAMMGGRHHNHDHDDDHDHTSADFWTNMNALGEALSGMISNAAWGIDLSLLVYQTQKDDVANYPSPFYVVAGFFASLALASAWIHRKLNIVHAHGDTKTKKEDRLPLTTPQKVALGFDAVTHVGNISAPLSTLGYDQLAANVTLPGLLNPVAKTGILVFGVFAARAFVRTCDDAMGKKNKRDADEQKKQQQEQVRRERPVTMSLSLNREP